MSVDSSEWWNIGLGFVIYFSPHLTCVCVYVTFPNNACISWYEIFYLIFFLSIKYNNIVLHDWKLIIFLILFGLQKHYRVKITSPITITHSKRNNKRPKIHWTKISSKHLSDKLEENLCNKNFFHHQNNIISDAKLLLYA